MVAPLAFGFLDRTREREELDRVLAHAREGDSAALVVRGEAGIGKTVLLRYVARRAAGFRVARVTGVKAEMELPFAGIHQLCAPVLDQLDARRLLAESVAIVVTVREPSTRSGTRTGRTMLTKIQRTKKPRACRA